MNMYVVNLEHNISVAKQLNIVVLDLATNVQCPENLSHSVVFFFSPQNRRERREGENKRAVSLSHIGMNKAYTTFTKIKLYM